MPKKFSDNTPTQNTIKLLAYLLENDHFHTLTELAGRFEISKQTVIRSLERHDFGFFGELIKEKQGKEVAYRMEKSRAFNRLMRATYKADAGNRVSIKSKSQELRTPKSLETDIIKERKLPASPRVKGNDPLSLAIVEYMQRFANVRENG